MNSFRLESFGPIKKADISFGDLTILVGPQASGKSLFLEMFKLYVDRNHVLETLKKYNYIVNKYNSKNIIEAYFGEGMGNIITSTTKVSLDNGQENEGKNLVKRLSTPASLEKTKSERIFYVPAQRIMSIDDGRTKNFMEFDISTPYVLRNFSETMRILVQGGLGSPEVIFPMKNRLKGQMKKRINESIFHGSRVVLDVESGQRKMKLETAGALIPFMAWSAGQKEFLPLLLSFYCLSGVPNKIMNSGNYSTVIIEEPEMGLHPRAILSIVLQIIDLMKAGYRVIISTHSTILLEFSWAFNILRKLECSDFRKAMLDLFEVKEGSTVAALFDSLYSKKINTYYFRPGRNGGGVSSIDISSLDAGSTNDTIAEWGGLSSFSGRANDIVLKYSELV